MCKYAYMQISLTQEFSGLDVNREILNVLQKWILITKVNFTHCNNNHINFIIHNTGVKQINNAVFILTKEQNYAMMHNNIL